MRVLLRTLLALFFIAAGLLLGGYLLSIFPSEYPMAAQPYLSWWHRLDETLFLLAHAFMLYAGITILIKLRYAQALGPLVLRSQTLRWILFAVLLIQAILKLSGLLEFVYIAWQKGEGFGTFRTMIIIQSYSMLVYASLAWLLRPNSDAS